MEKRIVACIDGSSSAASVCDWAAWASLKMNLPLTLLHVFDAAAKPVESDLSGNIGLGTREALLDELAELDEQRAKLALAQGKFLIDAAKKRVEEAGVGEPLVHWRHSSLPEALEELSGEIKLAVLGRQGIRSENSVVQIGSQIENVIRVVQRPILISVPPFREPERVMIAYDGSPTAKKVLELAANSELMKGRVCHVVTVGTDADGQLEEARQFMEKAGHQAIAALLSGDIDVALSQYAEENDIHLMIMGAFGHSRIRQFFVGSTTTKMLHGVKIPLLILR